MMDGRRRLLEWVIQPVIVVPFARADATEMRPSKQTRVSLRFGA